MAVEHSTKRCLKCKRILALDNFHKQSGAKGTLRQPCKQCRSQETIRKYNENNLPPAPKLPSGVKFAPVTEYPGYGASSDGRLWTCRVRGRGGARGDCYEVWKPMKTRVCFDSGYLQCTLQRNGRIKLKKVAPVILAAFRGPKQEGQECRHLDGNRLNNDLSNLQWGTHKENTEDMIRHGRAIGKPCSHSDELVATIRELAKFHSQREISKQTGVNVNYVARLIRGERRATPIKTHCPYGHEYTPQNTRVVIHADGHTTRCCRQCKGDWQRRKRAADKAAREQGNQ